MLHIRIVTARERSRAPEKGTNAHDACIAETSATTEGFSPFVSSQRTKNDTTHGDLLFGQNPLLLVGGAREIDRARESTRIKTCQSSINHLNIYMNIEHDNNSQYSSISGENVRASTVRQTHVNRPHTECVVVFDLFLHHGSNKIGRRKFFAFAHFSHFCESFLRSNWIRNFSSKIIIVNKLTMNGVSLFYFFSALFSTRVVRCHRFPYRSL